MNLLFVVSAAAALLYGAAFCYQPHVSNLKTIIKTTPVMLLALLAFLAGAHGLLVCGLLLSAMGDMFLSRDTERTFLAGLVSFATAHLCYIVLFSVHATGWPPMMAVIVFGALAISTEFWLSPYTQEMRWPVRLYVVLIALMGMAAFALPHELCLVALGAVLFAGSDTLLSVQLFRMSQDHAFNTILSILLWVLYYCAQLLILLAFVPLF